MSEDDWRAMRRQIPSDAVVVAQKSKKDIDPPKDDNLVKVIPGGLEFVKPSGRPKRLVIPVESSVSKEVGTIQREPEMGSQERRIRRGEVGKDMNEVVKLEKSGFVMTGSRNSRLTLLQQIKDSETVSEDQRREELMEKMAARDRKEEELLEGFRQLLMKKQRMH
jgi:hypothetical protein